VAKNQGTEGNQKQSRSDHSGGAGHEPVRYDRTHRPLTLPTCHRGPLILLCYHAYLACRVQLTVALTLETGLQQYRYMRAWLILKRGVAQDATSRASEWSVCHGVAKSQ
jgi:hypothetical protein